VSTVLANRSTGVEATATVTMTTFAGGGAAVVAVASAGVGSRRTTVLYLIAVLPTEPISVEQRRGRIFCISNLLDFNLKSKNCLDFFFFLFTVKWRRFTRVDPSEQWRTVDNLHTLPFVTVQKIYGFSNVKKILLLQHSFGSSSFFLNFFGTHF
jgi:hypothetical protein